MADIGTMVISTNGGMTFGGGGAGDIVLGGFYDDGAMSSSPMYSTALPADYHQWCGPLSECKGADEMEIGGNTCHLCGEKIIGKNTYGHLGKRGQWKTATYVRYQCGTTVEISAKGKKSVVIGDDCIQI
jgi:hypothetical protein